MSVICHNFVQNAWKKDLCSNCFKSVGDHNLTDCLVTEETNLNKNLSKFSPKISNGFSSLNSAPHTTWKNLIAEKNSKNNQLFKLETGFQGRLLTINTGNVKQIANKSNGFLTKSSSSDDILNGHAKEQKLQKTKEWILDENEKLFESKTKQNGSKNNGTKNSFKEEIFGESCEEKHPQPKLVKSKSEDILTRPLHSILKKTTSVPVNGVSNRRTSNVGFKDEDPLVIGYGGRDFTPEELEWDVNASEIDIEKTWDSLDETEDDKAFSKMTKENTEFNADSTNLLKTNPNTKKEAKFITPDATNNSNKITHQMTNGNNMSKKNEPNPDKDDPPKMCNKNAGMQIKNENFNHTESPSFNGLDIAQQKKIEKNLSAKSNQTFSSNQDKETPMNGPLMKNDKKIRVDSKREVTVVESKTAKVGDKNNSDGNEAALPVRVTSGRDMEESLRNAVMFADGEENEDDPDTHPDGGKIAWRGDAAGQILQAINTSLTNRHKMNEEQTSENIKTVELSSEQDCEKKMVTQNKVGDFSKTTNHPDEKQVGTEDGSERSENYIPENCINVEPRASFLHGINSNNYVPSAIYGPASDLFVSCSNSSSSTSLEEAGKPTVSHSINVIVNGKRDLKQLNEKVKTSQSDYQSTPAKTITSYKSKPKVPIKPLKNDRMQSQEYHRTKSLDNFASYSNRKNSDSSVTSNGYYSISNIQNYVDEQKSISLVDHYAETNIYHEVDSSEASEDNEVIEKSTPIECKLAALAVELEQARNANGNTKRQAPAPPKIPDPPAEDPPNCAGPRILQVHGFPSYRREATSTFSSSSSTASTSSQETETGYASWNLNGTDTDENGRKTYSKGKGSFLQTQYSKCKMLAMGYTEDGTKMRKKFSLKKLLKIKKDNDASAAFDPNAPNPKAWKYSDHFERPRAKLEIIHPMDLENKSVTVNPGFDHFHSGSLSSFTMSADDVSLKNSASSDYGSFYSDTLSPAQDIKTNRERLQSTIKEQEKLGEINSFKSLSSPTPSRISSGSQASTLTSGSSKNDGAPPHRPPKPPPPPRAHSLQPGNKPLNPNGTFKFPLVACSSTGSIESTVVQLRPQAPKRQNKTGPQKSEIGIYDNSGLTQIHLDSNDNSENTSLRNSFISIEGCSTVLDIGMTEADKLLEEKDERSNQTKKNMHTSQTIVLEPKSESSSINVTVKTGAQEQFQNSNKNGTIPQNKSNVITKAPARPPPIYVKSQLNHISKNTSPWKTLEDSYLYITQANRDLLIKIVNQSLKKRNSFLSNLNPISFQWSDFEIDIDQPSDVFAFGEKIAYHAKMTKNPGCSITLVITVQQQQTRISEVDPKYPVLGQFIDYIPKELLDNSSDMELESIQATILVLYDSTVSTIECFSDSLPESLTEENEKELCFLILQTIHFLKSLQAHGVESIEPSFQNLILAKTKLDSYNTLVFLLDNCFEENDYLSDSCKISLCQYVLMLLFQLLGVQSEEEFRLISSVKFSSKMSQKVFQVVVSLLVEEKAVSLSQTKMLLECFLWEVTKVLENVVNSDDLDSLLHRWMDIKRCNFIKSALDENGINMEKEYFSRFLIRTSARNIREVISYL